MVAAFLLMICASIAQAGEALYVDDDAPLGGDGAGWETAFRYLQDALYAAQPGSGVDEIHVGQGTYKPDQDEGGNVYPGDRTATFQLIDGVSLLGGYAGYGTRDPNVRNIDLYETILSGDLLGDDEPGWVNYDENSYHVIVGSGVSDEALVEGLTITAGHGDGIKDDYQIYGAGMFNDAGSPIVRDCTFHVCLVQGHGSAGGAVYNMGGSEPLIEGCTFEKNRHMSGGGGGGAIASVHGSPIIRDCRFQSNRTKYRGGAIFCEYSASSITNCVFTQNTAVDYGVSESLGGGAVNMWYSPTAEIRDCLFESNQCLDYVGGALSTVKCSPTVSGCVFVENFAYYGGGAVAGVANLSDCYFDRNEGTGAGIRTLFYSGVHVGTAVRCRFVDSTGSAVSLSRSVTWSFVDCQFLGGHSSSYGGAVRAGNELATVSFVNCIFSGNSADDDGGAIFLVYDPDVTIINCTFSANTCGGLGGAVYCKSSHFNMLNCVLRDQSYNEIFQDGGGAISVKYSCVAGGFPGEGNIDADPLFAAPDGADGVFGTEDDNLRLLPGSPCIDAADNTAVPYDVTTDLDGNPRFVDDPDTDDTGFGDPPIVDMGAYEFQAEDCPADVNFDGIVDIDDLFAVLAAWGACDDCPEDINDDGVVDIDDLFEVLAAWGPCS